MNKKTFAKIAIIGGLILGVSGTAIASASGYWTVSEESVGAHGAWSSYGSRNLKKTNSNVASFNGDALPAALGYRSRLINAHASSRSDFVTLKKNSTAHAGNNSGKRNYYYYADVRSSAFEPNTSRVKLHFSADRK